MILPFTIVGILDPVRFWVEGIFSSEETGEWMSRLAITSSSWFIFLSKFLMLFVWIDVDSLGSGWLLVEVKLRCVISVRTSLSKEITLFAVFNSLFVICNCCFMPLQVSQVTVCFPLIYFKISGQLTLRLIVVRNLHLDRAP